MDGSVMDTHMFEHGGKIEDHIKAYEALDSPHKFVINLFKEDETEPFKYNLWMKALCDNAMLISFVGPDVLVSKDIDTWRLTIGEDDNDHGDEVMLRDMLHRAIKFRRTVLVDGLDYHLTCLNEFSSRVGIHDFSKLQAMSKEELEVKLD